MPLLAAIAEEIDVVNGMARPSACGQEMTSTVTTRVDRLVGVAEREPHDPGDHRRAGGDVEEERGGTVGEHLRP